MSSYLLYFGTNGSESPTKAVIPFLGANGAVEAGIDAKITLFGDAVVLMKDVVANAVHPMGWPPLAELLAKTLEHKIPIFV
jgi:predicted peroxiredoxin